MNTLSERLVSLRKQKNISQATVAKDTGINRNTLSQLEVGQHTNPTIGTIETLSEYYNVSPSWLAWGK